MFLLPDNFSKKDLCEGCSFLGLYDPYKDCCILCDPESPNEDTICKQKFSGEEFKYEKYIGYYLETIDAISKKYQMRSSSGGLITGLLSNMLEKNEIDYAIVVGFSVKNNCFEYMKVDSAEQLIQTQRSAYYPISLQTGLDIIKNNDGYCAITCIPSAAKAIEILKAQNKELNRKIKYTIGLTYNSTKKREYTEYLCKKAGKIDGMVNADYISYRDKNINKDSGIFGTFVVKSKDNTWNSGPQKKNYDWSIGLLQEFSSNFVDDHYAECADISVMDAWHKNYQSKHNGTSLAIIRNHQLFNLLQNQEDILYNPINQKIILESQKSGINFKNKELGIRLRFYDNIYGIKTKSRLKGLWGKNPMRILRVLLRLWVSIKTEQEIKIGKNIDRFIRFFGEVHSVMYKIENIFSGKGYFLIGSTLNIGANLGDQAFFLGLINNLQDEEITILTVHGSNVDFLKSYENIKFIFLPKGLTKEILFLWKILFSRGVKKFKKIYCLGADSIDGKWWKMGRTLFIILYIGKHIAKSTEIITFSFTKTHFFRNKTILKKLEKYAHFYPRDSISMKNFKNEYKAKYMSLAGDSSFLTLRKNFIPEHIQTWILNEKKKKKKILLICPAKRPSIKNIHLFLDIIANDINKWEGWSVCVVRHIFDSETLSVCEYLLEKIKQEKIFINIQDVTVVRRISEEVNMAASCLLHCALGSIAAGTPVIVLDYFGKATGLFGDLNLQKYVCEREGDFVSFIGELRDNLDRAKGDFIKARETGYRMAMKIFEN